jgi:hypothetical protein
MKNIALTLLTLLSLSAVALAGEKKHDHDHDHGKDEKKIVAGPNKGRVLQSVEPHAEFLVTEDRKIKITFLDEELKPVPAADQKVTVTTGERSAPTKLTFKKEGDVLVSEGALPEGNNLPTVVQIIPTADVKAITEKFNLNLSQCPECKHGEYACICEHDH